KVKNKKKRAARKSSKKRKSSQSDVQKLFQALSLSMEPKSVKDHPDGKRAARESTKVDLRKFLEDLELSMERFKHHPDAVQRTDSETLRLPGDDILCGDWFASLSDIGEDDWDINGPFELMPFEVEEISKEPTTVEVKDHPHAVQQPDVSEPCCGDGGMQEIKDCNNTPRNQSTSDDILASDEDVESDTLSLPSDDKPLGILWGDPEEDIDHDLSEYYWHILGPSEPLRFEWEDNCTNLGEKINARPEAI
ncbi:hypothetical protein LINGRAHAP2_LOCUS13369, partial [Linum grandiflorum]